MDSCLVCACGNNCDTKSTFIYALVDTRDMDRVQGMQLYVSRKDAENMRESMGSDSYHYQILEKEIIL